MIANQEMVQWVHSPQGRAVFVLSGRIVPIVRGVIRPEQVSLYRPSYINGILIQSRGIVQDSPCTRCVQQLHFFTECRRVSEHFSGCCKNYKWSDVITFYTIRNPNETSVQIIEEDNPDCSFVKDTYDVFLVFTNEHSSSLHCTVF